MADKSEDVTPQMYKNEEEMKKDIVVPIDRDSPFFSELEKEAFISQIKKTKSDNAIGVFMGKLDSEMENASKDKSVPSDMLKDIILESTQVINRQKRVDTEFYVKACKFITLRDLGYDSINAWSIVYPERRMRMEREGMTRKQILLAATTYASNATIVAIKKLRTVPLRIAFADVKAKAVGKLVTLMDNEDSSDRIKLDAADKLLGHLVDPEEKEEIFNDQDMSMEDKGQKDKLIDILSNVVKNQRHAMMEGKSIDDIQNIHVAEVIERNG